MSVHVSPVRTGTARRPSYSRPLLPWVRRRARRLQAAFGLDRREAVREAAQHYRHFTGAAIGVREVAHG